MLSVRGVSVRYGSVTAVDAVDLDVPDGSVLALLGPSGCGKSTLLRAVAGLEPVADGSVSWDGVDLARVPVHRRSFGLMFQDGVLFPHRTVAGNVAYGLRRAGRPRDAIAARLAELLELVGLSGYGSRRVVTLSGGEAQRVALARALAPRPRLLLLDEPLAALDRALRDTLLADLRSVLRATGTTAIFVTHDQNEAFAVADQVAVMRAGRIRQSGEPRQVWWRPVDAWVARFVGCSSVIAARPMRGPDGSWSSRTSFGDVPGRAEQVGLRAAALVVDPFGTLCGEVTGLVPGPEHQRVSVRINGGASAGALAAPDFPEPLEVQAVAHPAAVLRVGGPVRLRWDPEGVALIGTVCEMEGSSPGARSDDAEPVSR